MSCYKPLEIGGLLFRIPLACFHNKDGGLIVGRVKYRRWSNADFLLGAARPLPPSAETLVREGSPLVKLQFCLGKCSANRMLVPS